MIFLVLYYLIDMRRPFLGVITVLPVAAIVLGTYMGMYLLDIPLNPVTSTLSGLAIGIGVPFVIHVTNRFRETISSGIEPVEAIRTTLKTTGGSLFGSAFTTMAGFGIYLLSSQAIWIEIDIKMLRLFLLLSHFQSQRHCLGLLL